MKFRVFVSFRKGILDPEAEAIKKTIKNIGYTEIKDLSKGKFFDINLESKRKDSKKIIEEISEEILSNPIIENFKINILD